MRNILSIILTFLFCLPYSDIKSQNLYFKHLGIKDGLSQVCIPSIYQDEYGAIWIGTSEGLNRYNGCSVQNFQNATDSIWLKGHINKVTGNRNGYIYILSGGSLNGINIRNNERISIKRSGVQDVFAEKDTLWMVSDNSILYHTEDKTELFYKHSKHEKLSKIYIKGKSIYVSTQHWLYEIDKENPAMPKELSSFESSISCILADSQDTKWIGTWRGTYKLSPNGEKELFNSTSEQERLTHNQTRCIIEDNLGNIWIGTFKGLDCFDKKSNTWRHYAEYGSSPNVLSHSSILCLHKDMDGNILAGTYFGGVNMFNPDPQASFFYQAEPLRSDWLNFPVVSKMSKDKNNNLWICTEGGGLNLLDKKTGKFSHLKYKQGDNTSINSNNLKSIYIDNETDKVYIGTHLGGLYIYDNASKRGKTYRSDKTKSKSLPNDIVNRIQPYKDGLVIQTQSGVVYMDKKTETFSELPVNEKARKVLKKGNLYETMTLDSRNRIWLGHVRGGVTCVNLQTSNVEYYNLDSLKNNSVTCIYEDGKGEIYVCTLGSGLFHYVNHKNAFDSYTSEKEQIPNDFCYAVCSAKDEHHLYMIHGNGISLFNTIEGKAENSYRLFNQSYSIGSSLFRNDDGKIYIGGTNGLATIDENIFYGIKAKRPIRADRMYIYNEEITTGDSTGILKQALPDTKEIKLEYRQDNITIEFSSFDYLDNVHQPIEYRLNGFDRGWNTAQSNKITYTNLSPGDYELKVRYAKSDDKETPVSSIKITIAPPFYASNIAYIIYTLMIIGIITLIIKTIIRQTSLRTSLSYERKEKERIEAVNEMKTKFYTNISHEFITPITIIMGQIESLLNSENMSISLHNKLLRIHKNAWNLRKLTSEILDYQKQEDGNDNTLLPENDTVLEYIPEEEPEYDDIEEDIVDTSAQKPSMMIVEENEELSSVLKDVLQPTYTIHICNNGTESLDMTNLIHPDIIIIDIDINGQSGKELCYKIKNNVELSDISVIIVTGDTTAETMMESFTFGTDAYMTKPFDVKVLQSRCMNILKNKKRIIAWCGNNTTPTTTENDATNNSDRTFLKSCIDMIKENFDNPEFDVTALSNNMNMGRTKFYARLKQITGVSPNEFITKIKLEEAMLMLKENPELNISEISVRLGFSSPRYFSRMFKKFFGVAPQSVRK